MWYAVVAPNGDKIFTGTSQECWQYMEDEGLSSQFRVVKL